MNTVYEKYKNNKTHSPWISLEGALLPYKNGEGEIVVWEEVFGALKSFSVIAGREEQRCWSQAICKESSSEDPYIVDRWDKIFFKTAKEWSSLSPDSQTKCGCVLVTGKEITSTGYNGFMRDLPKDSFRDFDEELPKTRPEKYPYMIHAEQNAIYNAARRGRSTIGTTAYITGIPCLGCLQALYQSGVKEVKFTDISNPKIVVCGSDYDKICFMAWSAGLVKKYFPKEILF